MQLDRNAINRMLSLSDDQLKALVRSLAESTGLDLSSFNISAGDIESIRRALSGATDADIARAAEQLKQRPKRP